MTTETAALTLSQAETLDTSDALALFADAEAKGIIVDEYLLAEAVVADAHDGYEMPVFEGEPIGVESEAYQYLAGEIGMYFPDEVVDHSVAGYSDVREFYVAINLLLQQCDGVNFEVEWYEKKFDRAFGPEY